MREVGKTVGKGWKKDNLRSTRPVGQCRISILGQNLKYHTSEWTPHTWHNLSALRASCMNGGSYRHKSLRAFIPSPMRFSWPDLHICGLCVGKTTSQVSSHAELSTWALRQSLKPYPFEWVQYRNEFCSLLDKEAKWVLIEVMYLTSIHSNRRRPSWHVVNKGR